jgi:hypothetical protein
MDDTSSRCSDTHLDEQMCYNALIMYGQDMAQIWEHLLYSFGSAIELCKCFWYLVLAMDQRTTIAGNND